MADEWCCKGTDPLCDGPQECASRAADEIERLRAALWLASEVALIEIADPADTSVDDVVLLFLEEAAQADKTKEADRG